MWRQEQGSREKLPSFQVRKLATALPGSPHETTFSPSSPASGTLLVRKQICQKPRHLLRLFCDFSCLVENYIPVGSCNPGRKIHGGGHLSGKWMPCVYPKPASWPPYNEMIPSVEHSAVHSCGLHSKSMPPTSKKVGLHSGSLSCVCIYYQGGLAVLLVFSEPQNGPLWNESQNADLYPGSTTCCRWDDQRLPNLALVTCCLLPGILSMLILKRTTIKVI